MRNFKNILIIKLGHLGDVLTTTPVVAAVKDAWPEARVGYVVERGCEDLVRYHPDVSAVYTVPRGQGVLEHLRFLRGLKKQGFDLALELSWRDRGAFLARVSRAGTRVGYRPKTDRRWDRRRLFTHLVTTKGSSKHTVQYHLDSLRVLDLEPGAPLMSMYWPLSAETRVKELLARDGITPGEPYAVVHPTSRWMFKSWRPDGNAAVVDYLSEKLGLRVVLTSGPEERELDYNREVRALVKSGITDLSGCVSLTELAALIAGARLFFGVDSLPMHVAAAVGTPAVALFGPSGEHMWAPWGKGHQVVAKDWDCRPCGRDGCQGSKISRCLVEIEPKEVYPALENVRRERS